MRIQITSGFHEHDAPHTTHLHQGIDFAMPSGTPVRAFESGTVTRVTHDGTHGFGNAIYVKFNDGYSAVYGHLDTVYVKPGDHVYTTQAIGLSGNTGVSTGPHLHLGIMNPQGHWIDPSHYVALDKAINPTVLYGVHNWSDDVVSGWFNQIGNSLGEGLAHFAQDTMIYLIEHMPIIVATLLVVGGFLKMFGAAKWSTRLFVYAGVGTAWKVLS